VSDNDGCNGDRRDRIRRRDASSATRVGVVDLACGLSHEPPHGITLRLRHENRDPG
jgi:hypothetical protein